MGASHISEPLAPVPTPSLQKPGLQAELGAENPPLVLTDRRGGGGLLTPPPVVPPSWGPAGRCPSCVREPVTRPPQGSRGAFPTGLTCHSCCPPVSAALCGRRGREGTFGRPGPCKMRAPRVFLPETGRRCPLGALTTGWGGRMHSGSSSAWARVTSGKPEEPPRDGPGGSAGSTEGNPTSSSGKGASHWAHAERGPSGHLPHPVTCVPFRTES